MKTRAMKFPTVQATLGIAALGHHGGGMCGHRGRLFEFNPIQRR